MPDFDLFQMSQPANTPEMGQQPAPSPQPDAESTALAGYERGYEPRQPGPDPGNAQPSRGVPEFGYQREGPPEVESQPPGVNVEDAPPGHLQVDAQEVRELRNRLQQYELYRPLLDRVNQDPTIIDRVFGVQANQGNQMPELPSRPERPIDYSRAAAIQDPGSSSARYEQQLMEYNEALANYNHQVVQMQQQRTQAQEAELLRQRREQMMREQQQQAIRQELTQREGLSPQEVQDFENWANSQDWGDVKNVVRWWRMDRQLNQNRPDQVRQQMEQMRRTSQQGPAPVSGSPPPMMGPGDQMVDTLRKYSEPYNGERRYGRRAPR